MSTVRRTNIILLHSTYSITSCININTFFLYSAHRIRTLGTPVYGHSLMKYSVQLSSYSRILFVRQKLRVGRIGFIRTKWSMLNLRSKYLVWRSASKYADINSQVRITVKLIANFLPEIPSNSSPGDKTRFESTGRH